MRRFHCILLTCLLSTGCGLASEDEGHGQAPLRTTDDANKPADVVQSSARLQPMAELNPSSLNLGAQLVGTTSTPLLLTVHNTSTVPQSIVLIMLNPPFAIQGSLTLPMTVAAGGSVDLPVTFAPTSAGTFTNNIYIGVQDTSYKWIELSGTLSGTGQ